VLVATPALMSSSTLRNYLRARYKVILGRPVSKLPLALKLIIKSLQGRGDGGKRRVVMLAACS
jgi:hypothetical protein